NIVNYGLLVSAVDAASVGVCYGRVANNLPLPATVVGLLQANGIRNVRLFDTDAATLRSFSGTGISLMIGVPNESLPSIASGTANSTIDWLITNVFSHIPPPQVKYLSVGNEAFVRDSFYTPYVVPAVINLHGALQTLDLANRIKISSPQPISVLSSSYPPSSGSFDPIIKPSMIPLLQFLRDSGSPLMVNLYPYQAYAAHTNRIPLDYALFKSDGEFGDAGLMYDNLLDASIDAFVHAMEREGFQGIKVVVAETGWPTACGEAASVDNALTYNDNVVRRAANDVGTPKRPKQEVEVYLFDLFDENERGGDEYEKHYGIFTPAGVKLYDLRFSDN
ncbi:Glucan endo-1,3-beta-glucosidase 13, partial [Linum perenne]